MLVGISLIETKYKSKLLFFLPSDTFQENNLIEHDTLFCKNLLCFHWAICLLLIKWQSIEKLEMLSIFISKAFCYNSASSNKIVLVRISLQNSWKRVQKRCWLVHNVVCECVCKLFCSVLFEKCAVGCGLCPLIVLRIAVGKMLVLLNKSPCQVYTLKDHKWYPQAPGKFSAVLPCICANPWW